MSRLSRQLAAIAKVLEALKREPEPRAAFIKGSLAIGAGDDYSDVDFYCLVKPDGLGSFLGKRLEILAAYRPVIFHSFADFVGPQVVAVFDDGLHFDFYTVTEERFPRTGPFRTLWDPDGTLDKYAERTTDYSTSSAALAREFDSFCFSLVEFHAAYERGDLSWATRLASHLGGHVAMILRHRFDPANAVLGMKRLETILPAEVRTSLRAALAECVPEKSPTGVLGLCDLIEESVRRLEGSGELGPASGSGVDWRLFELMKGRIAAAYPRACRVARARLTRAEELRPGCDLESG